MSKRVNQISYNRNSSDWKAESNECCTNDRNYPMDMSLGSPTVYEEPYGSTRATKEHQWQPPFGLDLAVVALLHALRLPIQCFTTDIGCYAHSDSDAEETETRKSCGKSVSSLEDLCDSSEDDKYEAVDECHTAAQNQKHRHGEHSEWPYQSPSYSSNCNSKTDSSSRALASARVLEALGLSSQNYRLVSLAKEYR